MRSLVRNALAAAALFIGVPVGAQRIPRTNHGPTLVVLIAIDQMRPDYFERYLPQLSGGLGRLYRGGAVFTNAYQDHAITETAPGHASMLSGRFPSHTGIINDTLGVPDPRYPLVGGGDPTSPYRFRGSALIDWMRFKDPRSRALSVSRKNRGAILPIGRAPENVFWYAPGGRFSTSTYYADTLPTWVQEFNAKHIPQSYAGKSWTLLLPESSYPEPDSVPRENAGREFVFPHLISSDPAVAARTFLNFPMMDSLIAQFALAGVNATGIGKGPQADLLSVSFSTTDAIGHNYGPDSRELHDQVLRLDRYMGAFIDSLYKLRDSSTIVFALTSDHGVQPNPDIRAEREHVPSIRSDVAGVINATRRELRAAGADSAVLQYEKGLVWLNRESLTGTKIRFDSVLKSLATSLRKVPGVARVDYRKDLARADTLHDVVARRWAHMLPPDFEGDLLISLAPYAYYTVSNVAAHGTPNDLDAHVPVMFYGPWFKAGKYTKPALVVDIAPTLAAVLDVEPSEKLDGRARTEAIRKP